MSKVLSIITGLVAAGIAFVVLYPILGVTLWVSFVVAGCLLILGTVASGTTAHSAH